MDEHEIDAVRALLQSHPRPANLAERCQRLDLVAADDPIAPDIRFEHQMVVTLEAEWSLAPGSDTTKTLLFFHGGGYCSGSIQSHRRMVAETGRAARVRTLALGYRLAPENPFPAALDDALAALEFLLAQGVTAASIAIGGDSAGGGLTLATMIRLRDAGRPLPGCAWLVSPWVDLEMTGASMDEKAAIDPLIHRDYLEELAGAYLGGTSAETRPLQKALIAVAFAGAIALPAVSALDYRFGWSHVPTSVSVLGNALVALGLMIDLRVFRENSYGASTIEKMEDQKVISTGPYAWVRHPMYVGVLVLVVGTPLALGSYWGLLFLLLNVPILILRILDEEKMLQQELDGYSDYMGKVRYRLVPGLW